jgi:hypothetical protein
MANKTKAQLQEELELLKAQKETLEKEAVPKEKLKKESLLTRLRWWVRDAGTSKFTIAAIILAIISTMTGYSVSEIAIYLEDSLNESQNYIVMIVGLLQFLGVTIPVSKNPKKTKTLSNDVSV